MQKFDVIKQNNSTSLFAHVIKQNNNTLLFEHFGFFHGHEGPLSLAHLNGSLVL